MVAHLVRRNAMKFAVLTAIDLAHVERDHYPSGSATDARELFIPSPELAERKTRGFRMYKTCMCTCCMQESNAIGVLGPRHGVTEQSCSTKQMVVKVVNARRCRNVDKKHNEKERNRHKEI